MPNQQVNLYLPLKCIETDSNLAGSWVNKQYKFENDLYVLASICISDLTFGELALNLDRFEQIPRSLTLREIQWRVHVTG